MRNNLGSIHLTKNADIDRNKCPEQRGGGR